MVLLISNVISLRGYKYLCNQNKEAINVVHKTKLTLQLYLLNVKITVFLSQINHTEYEIHCF